jgi:hypothetical protein
VLVHCVFCGSRWVRGTVGAICDVLTVGLAPGSKVVAIASTGKSPGRALTVSACISRLLPPPAPAPAPAPGYSSQCL